MNNEEYTAKQAFKSVGKGWSPLIKVALALKPRDVKIVQVKEKFGCLRIYSYPYDPTYNVVLNTLESTSSMVCERCGKRGRLDRSYRWVKTLCPDCKQERKAKRG
jgi:hypothetical protein